MYAQTSQSAQEKKSIKKPSLLMNLISNLFVFNDFSQFSWLWVHPIQLYNLSLHFKTTKIVV
jgi:hypothetical protein